MSLSVDVRRRVDDIRDALASSLDIREVIGLASPLLLQLIKADYAALGVTRPGQPGEFDWIVTEMPAPFFEAYPHMAPHDFVLHSVLTAPNRVLRDSEMIERRALESNVMYRHAQDIGMALEHVMSTMLHVDGDWSSGLSLYRGKRAPFSDGDRQVLESIVPALTHAVRNCRLFATTAQRARVLEDLVAREGLACIVFVQSGRELSRTGAATATLSRWFSSVEMGADHLPSALSDQVRRWAAEPAHDVTPSTWERKTPNGNLLVRPYWLTDGGERYLVVILKESTDDPLPPPEWRGRLTEREHEVATRLIRGWDNRLIAHELGCAQETVKKHVASIFDKLGADRRGQLILRASRGVH